MFCTCIKCYICFQGHTKMLVTGPWHSHSGTYTVLMDGRVIATTLVQPGVLRCFVPGKYPFIIVITCFMSSWSLCMKFQAFRKLMCLHRLGLVKQASNFGYGVACDLSLVVRKPVFGVSDQVRHKLGCTTTEDGWTLEILDLGSRGIVLSV